MNVYLAAFTTLWLGKVFPNELGIEKKDLHSLITYVQMANDEKLAREIGNFKSFMLDSGAFTFVRGSKSVDWDKYLENYADFINKYDVKLFFELDIDKLVGLDEVERMRFKLERLTGKKPIPVWHHWRGKQYLEDMCREYPYVAYGAFITDGLPVKLAHGFVPWAIETAHKHGAKIHGLGFTKFEELRRFHFDSVDSSTWINGNKYGHICKFYPQEGKIKNFRKPDGKRVRTYEAVLNNFQEWAKFCLWAENNL